MSIAILRIKYSGISALPKTMRAIQNRKEYKLDLIKGKIKKDSLEFQSELSKMSLLYQMVGVVELESTTSTMST